MYTPHSHIPALEVRGQVECMCNHGSPCTSFAPGHALHLIQSRLASATPSDWVDAIVHEAHADGTVVVRGVLDGATVTVWNGTGASGQVHAGAPVALHARYDVLAVGTRRFNVAPIGGARA